MAVWTYLILRQMIWSLPRVIHMASVYNELRSAFSSSAAKRVSRTDMTKRAYVVSDEQYQTVRQAGFTPGTSDAPTIVPIIDTESGAPHDTSYYNSLRQTDRPPEARMGRGLFQLISEGDNLLLATDGKSVFAKILTNEDFAPKPPEEVERVVEKVYTQLDPARLLERAEKAKAKPDRTPVTVDQFVRDPAVRAYVIRRCGGRCEVPGCGWTGFMKDDGTIFISVHHVVYLSEGGDDTIANAIGICPNCHAKAHWFTGRKAMAKKLLAVVAAANEAYRAKLK
jgi:hypothetical protein